VVFAGFSQGLAMGVTSLPLTTFAFASLPMTLRAEAASVFAIMRNIGQSIGISVMQTLFRRNSQAMHASLAAHVDPSNPVVHSGVAGAYNMATTSGLQALDAEINRQASMVAYLDDFRLMLVMAICAIPLVLLMPGSGRARAETIG
jgi:DHA2 family multidrug resistance protein